MLSGRQIAFMIAFFNNNVQWRALGMDDLLCMLRNDNLKQRRVRQAVDSLQNQKSAIQELTLADDTIDLLVTGTGKEGA